MIHGRRGPCTPCTAPGFSDHSPGGILQPGRNSYTAGSLLQRVLQTFPMHQSSSSMFLQALFVRHCGRIWRSYTAILCPRTALPDRSGRSASRMCQGGYRKRPYLRRRSPAPIRGARLCRGKPLRTSGAPHFHLRIPRRHRSRRQASGTVAACTRNSLRQRSLFLPFFPIPVFHPWYHSCSLLLSPECERVCLQARLRDVELQYMYPVISSLDKDVQLIGLYHDGPIGNIRTGSICYRFSVKQDLHARGIVRTGNEIDVFCIVREHDAYIPGVFCVLVG